MIQAEFVEEYSDYLELRLVGETVHQFAQTTNKSLSMNLKVLVFDLPYCES